MKVLGEIHKSQYLLLIKGDQSHKPKPLLWRTTWLGKIKNNMTKKEIEAQEEEDEEETPEEEEAEGAEGEEEEEEKEPKEEEKKESAASRINRIMSGKKKKK